MKAGVKVSLGLLVMLLLSELTGESWLATALVALFAWLANYPGNLRYRLLGMLAFALGAGSMTIVHGLIKVAVLPNVLLVMLVGFLGTFALIWGMRAFMVGYALICWAIYGPLMVSITSAGNCLLAIGAGTGILVLLNIIGDKFFSQRTHEPKGQETKTSTSSDEGPGFVYIVGYATTVALVLGLTTYFGWVELKTDPSLMAGGAFFVIGFDVKKNLDRGAWAGAGVIRWSAAGIFPRPPDRGRNRT